jgi:hypothetical protein
MRMASIRFPSDQTSYKGSVRFTLLNKDQKTFIESPGDGALQIEMFLPQGLQYADRVVYDQTDLGAVGGAMAGRSVGENSTNVSEMLGSEEIQEQLIVAATTKFSDKAGNVGRERFKVTPNPNTRALFKQVGLREFSFQFKLIPVNQKEAQDIGQIIKTFRTELYPEEENVDVSGVGMNLGYKFPNRFQIEQFYDGRRVYGSQKIAPSYLQSFSTNYNSAGQGFLRGEGGESYYSEVEISLNFLEATTLSRSSIQRGF